MSCWHSRWRPVLVVLRRGGQLQRMLGLLYCAAA